MCNNKGFKGLLTGSEGAVLPLIGLAFGVLILAAGFTIDYTRAQIVRERMQWAVDAGALAGAKVANQGIDVAEREANDYFRANFPEGYMNTRGGSIDAVDIPTENGEGLGIRFQVQGMTMENYIMDAVGLEDIQISALAEVNTLPPEYADIVFAVDVSGSMDVASDRGADCVTTPYPATCYAGQSKLEVAKQVMRDLVTKMSSTGTRFGLVPYSNVVNISGAIPSTPTATCSMRAESPANPIALVASESPSAIGINNALYNYEGNSASGPYGAYWSQLHPCYYFYDATYQTSLMVTGIPNYDGGVGDVRRSGSIHPMQFLTDNTAQIMQAINRQQPYGNTDGALGMYWAYRMYERGSINWNGWRAPGTSKAIILLSDGNNTFYYGNPGFGAPRPAEADAKQIEWCNAAKAAGIDVYTIAYDMSNASYHTGRQVLRDCASPTCPTQSGGKCYFEAGNDAALIDSMESIGQSMMTMRLTR